MNILACYPPGEIFQRGEDRCQSNIKSSTATSMRACNDLGYIAAQLRNKHQILLKDYQTELLSYESMKKDVLGFHPDYIVISTTNATVFDDIKIVNQLKQDTNIQFKVILKGAIFFDAEQKLLDMLDLNNIDILVGGEIDCVIKDIINNTKPLNEIPCIFYKQDNHFIKTSISWCHDLDLIPFPARDLMPNHLYTRPDTGEMMATIQTSRGCPSQCIYCLSPKISGKCIRYRSPQNVFEELIDCYDNYNIKSFFFKADTFTMNEQWVLELCRLIKHSKLYKNISYTANSRVKPISERVLKAMKDTGCFTIAFGLETGNAETMKKIKKGVTIEDNYNAVHLAQKVGIPVYGFYMIGFPWETKEQINDTIKMIFELNCDFIELHLALPYYGTEFYNICKNENTLNENVLGVDYFHSSTKGTKYVSNTDLIKIRKKALFKYHIRPNYIIHKLVTCKGNPKIIGNYIKYGIKLILNIIR